MFFSGYCFASGRYSLDTTPIVAEDITSITIKNGVYDEFYVTKNYTDPYTSIIPDIWDYDTVMLAKFNGDLLAGNATFSVQNTDFIRIKRRLKNTFKWVNLFEIPINTIEDFKFELFDMTPRSNKTYEYSFVPVYGNVEGNYVINELTTDFDRIFIMERDKHFSVISDVHRDNIQQNKPISVIPTLDNRYPFVISNGRINYKSGTLSGIFVDYMIDDCTLDFQNAWEYREALNNFLYDDYPKLLKYDDGRMFLISISSPTIDESEGEHELLVNTSFGWTEIDDCDDGVALYRNGFIDVENQR